MLGIQSCDSVMFLKRPISEYLNSGRVGIVTLKGHFLDDCHFGGCVSLEKTDFGLLLLCWEGVGSQNNFKPLF